MGARPAIVHTLSAWAAPTLDKLHSARGDVTVGRWPERGSNPSPVTRKKAYEGGLINGLLGALAGSSARHSCQFHKDRPTIIHRRRNSRSTYLKYSQGESMKILKDIWIEGLENTNHTSTGSGSSFCLAIPNWTGAFESPFLAS